MAKTSKKLIGWRRRKRRVRRKVTGTAGRPRLSVYRSSKHIYAQVIDDAKGVTLAAASTIDQGYERDGEADKTAAARQVGALIAQRCKESGVERVVFDRNGYLYTSGRVHALAESAREAGLKF